MDLDNDQNEILDLLILQRKYKKRLLQHPSCLDPDHPGCESCIEVDEEE